MEKYEGLAVSIGWFFEEEMASVKLNIKKYSHKNEDM
jgi:hypothetical protein